MITVLLLLVIQIYSKCILHESFICFFSPKSDPHTKLDEYKRAAEIGSNEGDCWSFYPDCPFSIFNIIPDVYTENDRFNITLDSFDGGTDRADDFNDIKGWNKDAFVKNVDIDLDMSIDKDD